MSVSATNNASWNGRKAVILENEVIQVVFLPGGGHIASMELKLGPAAGINPLWVPPWKTMDPHEFSVQRNGPDYGEPNEGPLLASISGHNLCLPWFGPPTAGEQAQGLYMHGEAGVTEWETKIIRERRKIILVAKAVLKITRFIVTRTISLIEDSTVVRFETVVEETRQGTGDREFGWQEHVTFGPPFLQRGLTTFDMSARQGLVLPEEFSKYHRLKAGAEFQWPFAPAAQEGAVNLRTFPKVPTSTDFTSQLNEGGPSWFTALNTEKRLVAGYAWSSDDFPWLGMWTENRGCGGEPWQNRAQACGMEFGLSPWPRRNLPRKVYKTPTIGVIPFGGKKSAVFHAFLSPIPFYCEGVRGVSVTDAGASLDLIVPKPA